MASVCAAYIYKYYTRMMTSVHTGERHTNMNVDMHVICTHSMWMTHSRGGGSREEAEGTLQCMLSMPVTHAAKHST